MIMRRMWIGSLMFSVGLLLLAGCGPKYPKCNNDESCQKGEFCVNGMCQQCRNDKDCGTGKICNGGRCEAGCRTTADCAGGQSCEGGKCTKKAQCSSNADCPPNQECQNGVCVAPPPPVATKPPPCALEPVYFDFNESLLTLETTQELQARAKCIQSAPKRKLRLEGHCDPRGTEEYNLALGERRGQSVKRYLTRLGVDGARLRSLSKGKLEATGTDEASWARDRSVKFVWE
jgi:peptidoglycan-associated lipoprotein